MSRRRLGIRARLLLSFIVVLLGPLAVSLATLKAALSFLVPRAEVAYVQRIQATLETDYLPGVIRGLRLGEIQAALATGDGDTLAIVVKDAWSRLSVTGDSAEIVREDGTVLYALRGTAVRGEGLLEPLPPGSEDSAFGGALFPRLRPSLVPGLSFVDASRARYVWPLAPDAQGAIYGRYTFTVPGADRAVATVSGSYTAIAVGAGVLTFALLVVILSFRLSRLILVPLRRFSAAAASIAEGNLDVPILAARPDEFGDVASAFDEMRTRLRDSLVRLQRSDAERRQVVAAVTHDLKTPLTSIRGYVEGLRDGVADNPAARERYFSVILEKAAQLEGLIDGLFRLSRLELGEEVVRRELVSVPRLLDEPLARLRRDVEARGLHCELPERLPEGTVSADQAAVAQVVDNVVQNILRHAAGATTVRVETAAEDGQLVLVLSDDGPGFAPADLARVFEPFYRGDASRSAPAAGAGLGLAICRRIVEQHGGTIDAASRAGAVITIRLPLADAAGAGGRPLD